MMSKIPNKKHSKAELSRIKAQGAMQLQNSQVVNTYNKQLASKFTIVIGYTLPLLTIAWWILKKKQTENIGMSFEMLDFFIMVIPILLALLVALWIAIKRVLSRHNSAFISILCILCCFPIAIAVNSSDLLKADLLSLIGKEPIIEDASLADSEEGDSDSATPVQGVMTDEERKELLEYERKLKKENEEFIRNKSREEALEKARKDLGL